MERAVAGVEMDPNEEGNSARQGDGARDRMASIINKLQREAEDRVNRRNMTEKRWLADLRQYHGVYDENIQANLREAKKSELFINQTRPKTHAMEARLSDMLFPTDDRNYGIQPTPVPELMVESEALTRQLAEMRGVSGKQPENQELAAATNELQIEVDKLTAIRDEANRRASAMEEEIQDHLVECEYQKQCRDVIRDACKLGTGVIKGPVIGDKSRRRWSYDKEQGIHNIEYLPDEQPVYWRVDPWNFFPDSDATDMEDCDGAFERHLKNSKALRRLAKEPKFDKDAIRRLLKGAPDASLPTYLAEVRSITGENVTLTGDKYEVWEYHGRLPAEDLMTVSEYLQDEDLLADLGIDPNDPDPLLELEVVVWFCQNELLKFGIHHLESGEQIYSVFNLEADDASIFGFGVPYIMRDSQSALCAAWRLMMDNAGLSSGPQIVVDDDVVYPAEGDDYTLTARKVWRKKSTASPNARAFETFDIDMHQAELANIIEMARRNADEETAISVLAQGEQGTHTTQTAQGMSLLMNATNIVFRRIVKNFDDDMTVPNIRRMYDFLMQFSPKQHIKGDYKVDARGSSVLLVREMQSANLMAFIDRFGIGTPYEPYLKDGGIPALRKLAQTMMIPSTELIKTDGQIRDDEARKAAEEPPMDIEMMKLEMQGNLLRDELEGRKEIAMLDRETQMMKTAESNNMTLEKLRATLEDAREARASKERMFASEAALQSRMNKEGESTGGGGGYF